MEQSKPKRSWLAAAILENPLLVQALGLTAAILGAVSLRTALLVSFVLSVHIVVCECMASVAKPLPEWLRIGLYYLLGLAIACPTAFLLERANLIPAESVRFLLFLPLAALNSFTAARCERFAVRHGVCEALKDAVAQALGFSLAALLMGFLRELLGSGSIWDKPVSEVFTHGLLMPFGGFLMLGAMAAGLKMILRSLRGRGGPADKAMELAPENRVERLEKVRQLMEEPEPEPEVDLPPDDPVPQEQGLDDTEEPVGAPDGSFGGLDEFDDLSGTAQTMTPVEKALWLDELESLLDDLNP